ncbi:MAG: anaerobic ribonucleoside-triphosphate reductase activating protein [Alphaproteobacteria bacterium]|nr:anaerobic ribonucleoside-triphosphate reductase activating protein [Alphaproteobacteria bacterium]
MDRHRSSVNVLPVYDLTPFTLIDYPGRPACIVWFSGCNMRCRYCHNPQIVRGNGRFNTAYVLDFLKKRQGLLEGVVLSGGEALVYGELIDFVAQIKTMEYPIKLDTNGLYPEKIMLLHKQGYLDFIALDYKAPPQKFRHVTQTVKYDSFSRTLDYLCKMMPGVFEVRTTVHTDLLNEEDLNAIINDLEHRSFTGIYTIQNFTESDGRATLDHMLPQTRIINKNLLNTPRNYRVIFRNF